MDTKRPVPVVFVVVLVAAACRPSASAPAAVEAGRAPSAPPPRPSRSALDELNAVPPPPPDMRCDDMNAPQCMKSTRCVLVPPAQGVGGPYLCRESRGPCESGLAQDDPNFAAACATRTGCTFQEGRCVCFPQTRVPFRTSAPVPSCFCGGGPPRMCVVASGG